MNMRVIAVALAIGIVGVFFFQQKQPPPTAVVPVQVVTVPKTSDETALDAVQAIKAPKPVVAAEPTATVALPARPEEIVFGPLAFEPPEAKTFRHLLGDGTVIYLAPSHEFPLITLSLSFKGGASLDPTELPGLASMTARLIREGGTLQIPATEFDETLDFLATEVGVAAGETASSATMNCLTGNFDESLRLFIQMLRTPAFDAKRLETMRAQVIESLKQRNDDAAAILSREWKRLMYGVDHFESSEPTGKSVAAISREGMAELHRRIFHPGNMIVAVSGDFDEPEMLKKLEQAFSGWQRGEKVADPVAPTAVLVPGLYHVPKEIPQGKVVMGMRSIARDDPDAIPLLLLNDILGGGGFTSRIMQQVRSNEGLAYSARSTLAPRVFYPGDFRAGFESKNPTVALATKIVLDQIKGVRDELVTEDELETAKQSAIETFPRQFESKPQMLRVFVNDEWTSRPQDYWQTFRDKVRAVTREDLQRVAKKHLDPEKMAILVVGDWEKIAAGDEGKRASMKDFFGGLVKQLPLRDPLTLEPLSP
ncbi:MAG: pitrilysin family protein [Planctomycetia bacterium]|nr:pitrilysin family protein [Planctomycetia bacterium]